MRKYKRDVSSKKRGMAIIPKKDLEDALAAVEDWMHF